MPELVVPREPTAALASLAADGVAFRRPLLAWYRRARRDLPWRRTRDGYRVWLSEVMLQQTQVATVVGYFERFVAEFPTVGSLAAAREAEVLRLWEGLGYYRRARQLHRASQQLVALHGGEFPRSVAEIRALPGVGRYTAGAIASIAFDQPQPILEANTERLWCRLLGFRGDPRSPKGQALLWRAAEALLPRRGAGDFNQALMELGGALCKPKQPACDQCPVRAWCRAYQTGATGQIPRPKARVRWESVTEAVVVVRRRGRVLVRQCVEGERWAGLWDFPRFAIKETSVRSGPCFERVLADGVHRLTGQAITAVQQFTTLRHGVTRFRIELLCYTARSGPASSRNDSGGSSPIGDGARGETAAPSAVRWVAPSELDELPLHVTARELARRLGSRRGPTR